MYWLLGLVIELYFLIKWVGEDNTFDVLSAKKIRSINKHILEVDEGDKVEGEFWQEVNCMFKVELML